ncbi:MAG: cobalamin-binding protein [Gammaproteobacteria bacterium]|nr:cobalamin-binding protein [Gammaproteobacteria bacterium]
MRFALAICLCTGVVTGCTGNTPAAEDGVDDALRIVTLAPHLTELVYTVGAGDRLVGVVAYSDYPQQARSLPVIGDAFRLDPERLAAVNPDLILAWDGGNPSEVIDQLSERGYHVARLPADTLADVANNLLEIGRLTGRAETAAAHAQAYSEALERLAAAHADKAPISVFYQVSPQPLYTIGGSHPIGDMIRLCGGTNLFADLEQMAPVVSLEEVLARNPDVIIASADGAQLDQWSRWQSMTAVANDNLYTVDASLVTRPSTRMLQGAQQICTRLDSARRARDRS